MLIGAAHWAESVQQAQPASFAHAGAFANEHTSTGLRCHRPHGSCTDGGARLAARHHGRRANEHGNVTRRSAVDGGRRSQPPFRGTRTPSAAAHLDGGTRTLRCPHRKQGAIDHASLCSTLTVPAACARSGERGCARAIVHCARRVPQSRQPSERNANAGADVTQAGSQTVQEHGRTWARPGPLKVPAKGHPYRGTYLRPIVTPICSFKSKTSKPYFPHTFALLSF